jgi:hypothetical protein
MQCLYNVPYNNELFIHEVVNQHEINIPGRHLVSALLYFYLKIHGMVWKNKNVDVAGCFDYA